MRIDTGLARVKTGQRFAAVSSKGEVLVVGDDPKDVFPHPGVPLHRQAGCTRSLLDGGARGYATFTCRGSRRRRLEDGPVRGARANKMWRSASWYVSQRYRIDMTGFRPSPARAGTKCDAGLRPVSEPHGDDALRARRVSSIAALPYGQRRPTRASNGRKGRRPT
ncbi:hypothetical protein AB5I41_09715 [Sphingomonas sp. MMS24-JH45]